MTSRNTLGLAAAAIIALGAGLWFANQRIADPATSSEPLYPTLQRELDDITEVRVFGPSARLMVTLKRREDGWRVSERHDYQADASRLRRLLLALADARMFEAKTANPDHYSTLGVQDISLAHAGGVQLELHGGSQPYQLIIGNHGGSRDSYFVRRAGEAQSWLVDGALETDMAPEQWLHREVLNIAADRIQSATVSVGQARAYTVTRQARADENFTVDRLPHGKKLKPPSAADGFATALSAINLTDVARAGLITADNAKPAASSVFRTFDGLVVNASGYRDGERHYLTLTTSFDAEQAARFQLPVVDDATQTSANDDAVTGIDIDAEKLAAANAGAVDASTTNTSTSVGSEASAIHRTAQESQQLNQQLAGWAFQIPAFKYEALFTPVGELTE